MFLVALAALVLAMAVPAGATAEEDTGTTTTVGSGTETSVSVPAPAVSVPDAAPTEPAPEWTFRFLLPLTLVLGGIVVVGTIIAYFAKVTRQRYRVVE
jgi:hypothetical protein